MRLAENDVITRVLLERFDHEATFDSGDGRYYATILRDDGSLLVHHPFGPPLSPHQMVWAGNVLNLLNREVHHDGAWVCVFTNPQPQVLDCVLYNPRHIEYGRYVLIWIDQDGDPQFPYEWEIGCCDELRTFVHVIESGMESVAQKCESCWQLWHVHMRQVPEVKPSQTHRRAKGERAPSQH